MLITSLNPHKPLWDAIISILEAKDDSKVIYLNNEINHQKIIRKIIEILSAKNMFHFDYGLFIPFDGDIKNPSSLSLSEQNPVCHEIDERFFQQYWSMLTNVRTEYGDAASKYITGDFSEKLGDIRAGDIKTEYSVSEIRTKYAVPKEHVDQATEIFHDFKLRHWAMRADKYGSKSYVTCFYRTANKQEYSTTELNYIQCALPFFYRLCSLHNKVIWVALIRCDDNLELIPKCGSKNECYDVFKEIMQRSKSKMERLKSGETNKVIMYEDCIEGFNFFAVKLQNYYSSVPFVAVTASNSRDIEKYYPIYDLN